MFYCNKLKKCFTGLLILAWWIKTAVFLLQTSAQRENDCFKKDYFAHTPNSPTTVNKSYLLTALVVAVL